MASGLRNSIKFLVYCAAICIGLLLSSCFLPRSNPFDPQNPSTTTDAFEVTLGYSYDSSANQFLLSATFDNRPYTGVIWRLDWIDEDPEDLVDTTNDVLYQWSVPDNWNRRLYVTAEIVAEDGKRGAGRIRVEKPWTFFKIKGAFTGTGYGKVVTLFTDSSKNLWAGNTDGYAYQILYGGGDVKRFDISNNSVLQSPIRSIIGGNGANIWFGREPKYDTLHNKPIGGGLIEYNPSTGKSTPYGAMSGLPAEIFNDAVRDPYGKIWWASNIGVVTQYEQIKEQPLHRELPIAARAVTFDLNDNLWAAYGDSAGLGKYSTRNKSWKIYRNEYPPEVEKEKIILPTNTINCLACDLQGVIWIGTNEGLGSYDGHDRWVNRYLINHTKGEKTRITALETDRFGNVWVGTEQKLWRYDTKSQSWDSLPALEKILPSPWINALAFDGDRTLWVANDSIVLRHYILNN